MHCPVMGLRPPGHLLHRYAPDPAQELAVYSRGGSKRLGQRNQITDKQQEVIGNVSNVMHHSDLISERLPVGIQS